MSTIWTAVQNLLSPRGRVCSYDRAGSGWSEPGPLPRTMRQQVFELHALVEAPKISGPVVLVGNSLGGMVVRLYAEKYGSDVAGVVLVDPLHENCRMYDPKAPRFRVREHARGLLVPEPRRLGDPPLPFKPRTEYLADELQEIYVSRKGNPQPLGDLPLIVLGAGRRPAPQGAIEMWWKVVREELDEQMRDLARLSRNSRFVLAAGSTHRIPDDAPELVAKAVEEVLEAAVQKKTLIP